MIDENSQIKLRDIKEQLHAICDLEVSIATIHRVIGDFNCTLIRIVLDQYRVKQKPYG